MNILLTGGTGYIGSAVLARLVASGHSVSAVVRSAESAEAVTAAGASALVGDAGDAAWLATTLATVDGAIHTASPGDASSSDFDSAVVEAVVRTFGGSARPYVHTGGLWSWGSSPAITEQSPFAPPALTAWRTAVEASLLEADVAATVLAPGIAFGRGGGIPRLIAGAPRTDAGALELIGDGTQHWTTVHLDDLAALYALVLEQGSDLGYLLGVSGANPTVRELGEAAAGAAGVAPSSIESTRARFGELFADALLLDQQASGARARSLGWNPQGPTLVSEFATGSYAAQWAAR